MPHFVIEYSANLDDALDVDALLGAVHAAARDSGVFPLGGIRVRALRCAHYRIADGHPDNAFVHLAAMIGAGRTLDARREACRLIFEALTGELAVLQAARPLAVSFEMRELEPALNFKQNNLHEYVRQRGGEDS